MGARNRKSEIIRSFDLAAVAPGSGSGPSHRADEWDQVVVHVNVTVGGTLALVPQTSPDGTNFAPMRNEFGTAYTTTALAVGRNAVCFPIPLGKHFRLGYTVATSAVTATVDIEFGKSGGL